MTAVLPSLAEVAEVAAEHAGRTDERAEFPVEALDALRASGLLGLVVPVEYGGGGDGLSDMVDVTLRLSRVDMSVGVIFAMHCQQAVTVGRHARPRPRAGLLPGRGRG